MDKRKIEKTVVVLALVLGAVVAVAVSFSYWAMESEPVPKSIAAKIVVGMDKTALESMLGRPRKIYSYTEHEQWLYGHPFKWQYFTVDFGKDGTVCHVEYDR